MIAETDIAARVVDHLERFGWDVYQEVVVPDIDGRLDIAATRDDDFGPHHFRRSLLVCEAKRELSFALFRQAARWIRYAHTVWVAVPAARQTDDRREALRVARDFYGFGVFEVDGDAVRAIVDPRLRELDENAVLYSLRPEHKRYAKAGSRGGGHFTQSKATFEALAEFVEGNPRCNLEEAVPHIKHHYRSNVLAVSELEKAVKRGEVPGVKWLGWRGRLEFVGPQGDVAR